MFPRSLNLLNPESERILYKVIRLDNYSELPGIIISANVDNGLVLMQVKPKTPQDIGQQEFSLGANGIIILPK